MTKGAIAAAAILCAAIIQPAFAREPQPTGMALQQMQARDFATQASIAFPAVMAVLQGAGYRLQTAEEDTGLITAIGSTGAHLIWTPFAGFREKKQVPQVSAFVEQREPNLSR